MEARKTGNVEKTNKREGVLIEGRKTGNVEKTNKREECGWKVGRQEMWKRHISGKNVNGK